MTPKRLAPQMVGWRGRMGWPMPRPDRTRLSVSCDLPGLPTYYGRSHLLAPINRLRGVSDALLPFLMAIQDDRFELYLQDWLQELTS